MESFGCSYSHLDFYSRAYAIRMDFYFMRKVSNPDHTRKRYNRLAFFYDFINPVMVRIMGANINRRTIDNIRKAGWKILYEERLSSDIVRWIEAEPL